MKKLGKWTLWSLFIAFSIFIVFIIYALISPLDLPDDKINIYDINNELIYQSGNESNLKIEDCDPFIKKAIVDIEDKRFYSHMGFDVRRMAKSLYTNIKSNSIVEGGSTITQQYAKNIYLSNRQSIKRKVNEFFYALKIEMRYSKDEILEGYMNSIYYGHGVYGFQNAAKFYFGKEVNDLSKGEIALLIGIPNGPSYYSPFIDKEKAIQKRNTILKKLYEDKLLSKKEYEKAKKEEIVLAEKEYEKENEKNYYIDAVLNELSGMDEKDNVDVYTYYDANAQSALSSSIKENLPDNSELQSSGIVMEPYTGNIVALQGGNDYTQSNYNRAVFSKRQIASTIKPLLYYAAITQGFTPSSQFTSEPTTFTLEDGTTYTPENYNKYYPNKEISMIHAVGMSDNIYAEKTHLFLGMDTLKSALSAFDISAEANPSLALGTVNLSIQDLSRIYNTFASEGYYIKPGYIRYVMQQDERVYERKSDPKQLLDRDATLVLNQLLTSTYDPNNADGVYPTMYGKQSDIKSSVKSGTSDWDTWVVGYNPYYTVGIWNGYDDNREMNKKEYEISKSTWRDCFNKLVKDKKEVWYEMSDNIEAIKVDPISGKEDANGSTYWYLK